jgi:hypothetical protein
MGNCTMSGNELDEMRKVRGWSALVDAWPQLEALFVEEEKLGRAPKLFAAMQAIEGIG